MTDTKISGLSAGTTVASTDVFPAVETTGVGPVKKTALQIKTYCQTGVLLAANNLSDVTAATARTNLGLGGAAVLGVGTGLSTASSNVNLDLTHVNSWSGQQNFGTATLTDASSIAWNMNTQQVAKVTLGGNRTMAAPSNLVDGGTYILRVIQDGSGSRTLAYNAVFKWSGGTAPTLSTAAGAIDILTFISDGTNLYGVAQLAFA